MLSVVFHTLSSAHHHFCICDACRYNIMSYFANRAAAKRPTLEVRILIVTLFIFIVFLVFIVFAGVAFSFFFTLFLGREQPPALQSPAVSPSKPLRSRFVFFFSCITAFAVCTYRCAAFVSI